MSATDRFARLRLWCAGPVPRRLLAVVLLLGLGVETGHQITAGIHGPDNRLIDDGLHSALILASSALCAQGARRRTGRPSRAAWWCYATALLVFGIAEIAWSMLYGDGGDVPTPNATDLLYLATYPLFMAGLVLMIRARVLDVPWHRWLDGFVLVLVVATPGVLLVIEPVLKGAPIDLLGRAVTVAYPLGDVLLLGALVGTLPVMSWRLAGSWPWVAVGLVCFTVADSAYSLTAADVVSHDGPCDFLWSAGALAFAVGSTRLPTGPRVSREINGWRAIALPLGAQLVAVATQIYGWFHPLPAAERLLTIAVLAIAIAQIVVSRPRPPATAASPTSERGAATSPGARSDAPGASGLPITDTDDRREGLRGANDGAETITSNPAHD